LGKLLTGLQPGPFDAVDEATLNATLAVIDSLFSLNQSIKRFWQWRSSLNPSQRKNFFE
jgi:hypothetical protein